MPTRPRTASAAARLVPLGLALTLLLPTAARGADPIPLPDAEPWVHEPSGFRFPPDVGTFTRVTAFQYDDDGRNISVGYNDFALKVILTAYVYPARREVLERHFERVKRDVREAHPEAKLLAEGK